MSETNIRSLVGILANHASKWQEIGLQLGFTDSKLNSIATPPGQKASEYLRAMLGEWVHWTPETPHGKYATLEDLKAALRSNIVELGDVADDLEQLSKFNVAHP